LEGLAAVHEDAAESAEADPLAALIGQGGRSAANVQSDPRAITAFLVGLKSRSAALSMQRAVNEYAGEPLTAVLPGVALQEVWEITSAVEKTSFAVSALVVIVGLGGMLVALLTSLNERRREMAVLRSVGARPVHVFALILGEAAFLTVAGIVLGVAALYIGLLAGQSWLESGLGLFIAVGRPSAYEFGLIVLVAIAGLLIGLIPAYRIYRYSLADGMTVRM
ncbi:MAG: ABC transporter permease, partial [Betaproteobacteria bacterium]